MRKESNIFIGPIDVANITTTFALGMKSAEIKFTCYTFKESQHEFSYKTGKVIPNINWKLRLFGKNIFVIVNFLIKGFFFIYVLIKHNTFIFISPHTLFRNNLDLPVLSFFKKKIVFFFVGCQERELDFLKEDLEYICNRCTDKEKQNICLCTNVEKKRQRIQLFEKYSTYIVAQDDCAGYLKYKKPIWLHLIAERPAEKDYFQKHNEKKIRIVHFPSNPLIKLSNIIIPILNEIESEYNFVEIVIKSGIPHSEVIEELDKANIVVDALGLSYGMLATEAMARGCVVVVGEMNYVKSKIPDFACVTATSATLKYKIEELINNRVKLLNKAIESVMFYEKYHLPKVAAKYYKEKLDL